MRKTLPLLLLTLLALSSCNGNKLPFGKDGLLGDSAIMLDGPGSVYVPTEAELGEAALETVKEVYDAVEEAYKSTDWYEKASALDKTFCSQDWLATVAAVNEKDSKREGEIGFFEADYWVMGQDFDQANLHASDFVLEKIQIEEYPWEASVTLKLHNYSEIPVRVNLLYEGEWKVDDLTDLKNDFDWKKAMKEYLAE